MLSVTLRWYRDVRKLCAVAYSQGLEVGWTQAVWRTEVPRAVQGQSSDAVRVWGPQKPDIHAQYAAGIICSWQTNFPNSIEHWLTYLIAGSLRSLRTPHPKETSSNLCKSQDPPCPWPRLGGHVVRVGEILLSLIWRSHCYSQLSVTDAFICGLFLWARRSRKLCFWH